MPTPYYYGFKTSDVGQCLYKICDDNVQLRNFLGADNEDDIKAIFSDQKNHSLHEFIDRDEPLCPVIDFNLPVKILNIITPKLLDKKAKNLLCNTFKNTCLEIFSK
ncbi:hypothetical protein RclHR1_02290025 [Rhizophagus clarus]|uniref:Uncharacterized protein n=1 Tax=Rhizophagus clarus TaxID=94130 RepID=A0A2Z6R8M6_9GLOM|nr:hypothetical protein RclHR1_02290025 [Rhizophagus clarus]GES94528.1 hypothetical protein GLOIN_2v1770262 [Rhizophagus clarus]